MVSERQEELQAKINRLRNAAAQGESYERVVGAGVELTEEMDRSKEQFQAEEEKATQVHLARARDYDMVYLW